MLTPLFSQRHHSFVLSSAKTGEISSRIMRKQLCSLGVVMQGCNSSYGETETGDGEFKASQLNESLSQNEE